MKSVYKSGTEEGRIVKQHFTDASSTRLYQLCCECRGYEAELIKKIPTAWDNIPGFREYAWSVMDDIDPGHKLRFSGLQNRFGKAGTTNDPCLEDYYKELLDDMNPECKMHVSYFVLRAYLTWMVTSNSQQVAPWLTPCKVSDGINRIRFPFRYSRVQQAAKRPDPKKGRYSHTRKNGRRFTRPFDAQIECIRGLYKNIRCSELIIHERDPLVWFKIPSKLYQVPSILREYDAGYNYDHWATMMQFVANGYLRDDEDFKVDDVEFETKEDKIEENMRNYMNFLSKETIDIW